MMSEKAYAYYSEFSVGSEMEGYSLKVLSGYNGTAGDSLRYHAGSKFSTQDVDQDLWSEGSCAQAHGNLFSNKHNNNKQHFFQMLSTIINVK